MKTSIATVSISGTLREKLAAIAAAGFDGIEIFEQDFIADAATPAEMGALIRDHGLEVSLFQPFRDFEGLPAPLRARALDRAKRKFDLMHELGADLVLICSSVHPAALGEIDRAADDFRELGDIAAERGIRLGFEALAWGRHINDHRDAWEVVRRADHPQVGLILDSFHTLARKIDPDTIRAIPADKIFFVQLADAPAIDMDLLYWSRHFRNMPGEGDLDVTRFMRAVAATGYSGVLSLEIFNDQFRGASPMTMARDGHRSLVALMDDVRRLEPELALDLPDLPGRIPAQGVEFIEFATRGAEAETLARTLRSMGFTRTGRHISKSLDLWSQGEIRIILNSDEAGFASQYHNAHGTGVCDVGFRVDDAAATIRRARAMGARPFSQPTGPGEMDIPAIRASGGGVMHFLDDKSGLTDVWKVEFRAETEDEGPPDAGLRRIDHLAETMSFDEMLSWALFYTSIFDLKKAPMVDVVDPDGLVRSQAIQAPDRSLRLTLNGAETHRTFAGRFLSDSFGSTIQHIAFETDDIFDAVQKMAGNGFARLPIPQNYYDDLMSRFALGEAEVARLAACDILYDEDPAGQFLQFYSQPTPSGFFFEVVERRSGYDGYGAGNAPFRLAAQKRLMRPKDMPRV